MLDGSDADVTSGRPVTSAFDELFVDLNDEPDPGD
jgi:hypothetical protein